MLPSQTLEHCSINTNLSFNQNLFLAQTSSFTTHAIIQYAYPRQTLIKAFSVSLKSILNFRMTTTITEKIYMLHARNRSGFRLERYLNYYNR